MRTLTIEELDQVSGAGGKGSGRKHRCTFPGKGPKHAKKFCPPGHQHGKKDDKDGKKGKH